uniref:Larval glycoprotein n=1 Tax=Galaxias sp. D (Allibone et al., 1996) TaxID=126351 RepID=E5FY48_9TELE|nr:larval glycoprotein [Galaxias sp. D (Allibone et al., 1996)]
MDRSLLLVVLFSALVSCAFAQSCTPACETGEFCNTSISTCQCDPNASNSSDFGSRVVCSGSSATMYLSYCLLSSAGMNIETLHLNDGNCTGQVQGHVVTFSFNSTHTCGSTITTNATHILFNNGILVDVNSSNVITREDAVQLDMSCALEISAPELTIPLSLKISDSGAVLINLTSGAWTYTLAIAAFLDSQFTQAINSTTDLLLNDDIYVDLVATGLDEAGIVVVVDSCWATPSNDSGNSVRWDLIKHGCPNNKDESVVIQKNGNSTESSFSFKMFKFTGLPQKLVFVHCKVNLCVTANQACTPSCGSRRRRRSLQNIDSNVISFSFNWKI